MEKPNEGPKKHIKPEEIGKYMVSYRDEYRAKLAMYKEDIAREEESNQVNKDIENSLNEYDLVDTIENRRLILREIIEKSIAQKKAELLKLKEDPNISPEKAIEEKNRIGGEIAEIVAKLSPCYKIGVGAVLIDNETFEVASANNNSEIINKNCMTQHCSKSGCEAGVDMNACYALCAERQCIYDTANRDKIPSNMTMYVSISPCGDCGNTINGVNVSDRLKKVTDNISEVYFNDWYRNPKTDAIIKSAYDKNDVPIKLNPDYTKPKPLPDQNAPLRKKIAQIYNERLTEEDRIKYSSFVSETLSKIFSNSEIDIKTRPNEYQDAAYLHKITSRIMFIEKYGFGIDEFDYLSVIDAESKKSVSIAKQFTEKTLPKIMKECELIPDPLKIKGLIIPSASIIILKNKLLNSEIDNNQNYLRKIIEKISSDPKVQTEILNMSYEQINSIVPNSGKINNLTVDEYLLQQLTRINFIINNLKNSQKTLSDFLDKNTKNSYFVTAKEELKNIFGDLNKLSAEQLDKIKNKHIFDFYADFITDEKIDSINLRQRVLDSVRLVQGFMTPTEKITKIDVHGALTKLYSFTEKEMPDYTDEELNQAIRIKYRENKNKRDLYRAIVGHYFEMPIKTQPDSKGKINPQIFQALVSSLRLKEAEDFYQNKINEYFHNLPQQSLFKAGNSEWGIFFNTRDFGNQILSKRKFELNEQVAPKELREIFKMQQKISEARLGWISQQINQGSPHNITTQDIPQEINNQILKRIIPEEEDRKKYQAFLENFHRGFYYGDGFVPSKVIKTERKKVYLKKGKEKKRKFTEYDIEWIKSQPSDSDIDMVLDQNILDNFYQNPEKLKDFIEHLMPTSILNKYMTQIEYDKLLAKNIDKISLYLDNNQEFKAGKKKYKLLAQELKTLSADGMDIGIKFISRDDFTNFYNKDIFNDILNFSDNESKLKNLGIAIKTDIPGIVIHRQSIHDSFSDPKKIDIDISDNDKRNLTLTYTATIDDSFNRSKLEDKIKNVLTEKLGNASFSEEKFEANPTQYYLETLKQANQVTLGKSRDIRALPSKDALTSLYTEEFVDFDFDIDGDQIIIYKLFPFAGATNKKELVLGYTPDQALTSGPINMRPEDRKQLTVLKNYFQENSIIPYNIHRMSSHTQEKYLQMK